MVKVESGKTIGGFFQKAKSKIGSKLNKSFLTNTFKKTGKVVKPSKMRTFVKVLGPIGICAVEVPDLVKTYNETKSKRILAHDTGRAAGRIVGGYIGEALGSKLPGPGSVIGWVVGEEAVRHVVGRSYQEEKLENWYNKHGSTTLKEDLRTGITLMGGINPVNMVIWSDVAEYLLGKEPPEMPE